MLTSEPTPEVIAEWKRIFEAHRADMQPNRKTGTEVDAYFKTKYLHEVFDDPEFQEMVALSIMENEFSCAKLPKGVLPDIKSYRMDDVLVSIDTVSGEFHIESEDINRVVPVYDDLFVYRGLDEEDLKNCFLVAEYVKLTQS